MNIWVSMFDLWVALLFLDVLWDGFKNQKWHQVYRDSLIRGLYALGIYGLYLFYLYI